MPKMKFEIKMGTNRLRNMSHRNKEEHDMKTEEEEEEL
jgi:hypothetical protein